MVSQPEFQLRMTWAAPVFDQNPAPPRPGPMRAPPPRGNPDQFGARVSVLRLNGQPWGGRPNHNDDSDFFDRPVRINGAIVATVRLRAVQRSPQEHEVRFLRT
jgi:hypothetical protein